MELRVDAEAMWQNAGQQHLGCNACQPVLDGIVFEKRQNISDMQVTFQHHESSLLLLVAILLLKRYRTVLSRG